MQIGRLRDALRRRRHSEQQTGELAKFSLRRGPAGATDSGVQSLDFHDERRLERRQTSSALRASRAAPSEQFRMQTFSLRSLKGLKIKNLKGWEPRSFCNSKAEQYYLEKTAPNFRC